MPLSREELHRHLDAERAALRASLPGKAAEMAALWEVGQPTALAALERLSHNLYGSAGTFGFREVSAACKAVELAVRGVIDASSPASRHVAQEALGRVQAAVAAL